ARPADATSDGREPRWGRALAVGGDGQRAARRIGAPRVEPPVRPPRRLLPLGLVGQALADPGAVADRLVPGDAGGREVGPVVDPCRVVRAAGAGPGAHAGVV